MKHAITIALTAISMASAVAQTPAPVGQGAEPAKNVTAPGTATASQNARAGINPFTGQSRAEMDSKASTEQLKQAAELSKQRLQLQRDEVEALRIEVDRKKLMEQLNPPAPPVVAPPRKEKEAPKKKEVIPAVLIAPNPAKFETPELLGVVHSDNYRMAMLNFDGRQIQVKEGSTVGGRPIKSIGNNHVVWGNDSLYSTNKKSIPTVLLTDVRSGNNNSSSAGIAPPSAPAGTPSILPPNAGSLTLNPQGATRNTVGASGPTGVLGILPPPPPTLR
jgi:hypothetical protein